MRRTLTQVVAVAGAWLACTMGADAQTTPPATASDQEPHAISSQDLDLMRKDIRSH